MVAIAFSILFGFIAMSALAAIRNSVATGLRRGRHIQWELEQRLGAERVSVSRPLDLAILRTEPTARPAVL